MKKILTCFLSIYLLSMNAFAYECSQIRAEHILVNTKAEANAIEQKISDGEDFEDLAREYSLCPSSARGGDLGYFEKGQMVKSFEKAAFSMAIGEISEPVQTQFGWHIIKVLDKR